MRIIDADAYAEHLENALKEKCHAERLWKYAKNIARITEIE